MKNIGKDSGVLILIAVLYLIFMIGFIIGGFINVLNH